MEKRIYKLTLGNAVSHFKLITSHKIRVARLCFRLGLIRQGIMHDMSKYSPTEFFDSARFFSGQRSPVENARELRGYSTAWLHHKGRNKHHNEYWLDFIEKGENAGPKPGKIPFRYVLEMLCDTIAAGQTYIGNGWTKEQPKAYWDLRKHNLFLHADTFQFLDHAYTLLAEQGLDALLEIKKLKGQY